MLVHLHSNSLISNNMENSKYNVVNVYHINLLDTVNQSTIIDMKKLGFNYFKRLINIFMFTIDIGNYNCI